MTKRILMLGILALLACGQVLAEPATIMSAPVPALTFTAKPTATKTPEGAKIDFTVSAATDVAICIEDASGKIARHLAAGVLGNNAPRPLLADALTQSVEWNGKDDAGQPASGGPFKARVQLGMWPQLERYIGGTPYYWDNQIRGLTVSPVGEVYVLAVMGSGYAGTRAFVRVLDNQGQYRRTIVPYAANTPAERAEALGQVTFNGRRLPLVCNGYSDTLAPMLTGMPRQAMVWHPHGHLLLSSAVGSFDDVRPLRHILALDPKGGAPAGLGFVGPAIDPVGQGGDGGKCFDSVTVSPDGQWLYYSGYKEGDKKPRHAVLRGRWGEAELSVFAGHLSEPGNDDQHLSNPQGLATDAAGNVYVCDYGNDQVAIFGPDGKRLARFAVDMPQQIAIHAKSGAIFVASRKPAGPATATTSADPVIKKFSALGKDPPRQIWSQTLPGLEIMALDPTAEQARFWLAVSMPGRGMSLAAATEKDGKLEMSPPVGDAKGLISSGIMSGGRDADEVFLPGGAGFVRIDLKTGEQSPLVLKGTAHPFGELIVGRDGNFYIHGGGGQELYRFNAKGDPLPFAASEQPKLKLARTSKTLRGLFVTRDGTIYVLSWDYRKLTYLDSYDSQGNPLRKDIIAGLASGATGIQVDPAGNYYVTENIKPFDVMFPQPFGDRILSKTWKWFDLKDTRPAPWCYNYDNAYLSFWGCLLKFPAAGGTLYGLSASGRPIADAPADAVSFKSGYLARDVKVSGAAWIRPYAAYAGSHDFGADGSNCMCIANRMSLDDFGRLFVPDPFRFCVTVFDPNGNIITRIGTYGNLDSAGPGSDVPDPAIAFAWPRYVACMKDRMVVSDAVNRRLAVIGLRSFGTETCLLP